MAPSLSHAILSPAIEQALARGVTLLTPNQRAARAIRQAFDEAQRAAGKTLWTPADALPLETWLTTLWHQRILSGQESRVLLNRTQEHVLWREIILADRETPGLRSADALAEMAARAWSLLHLHNGRARLRDFASSTDSRALDRWSRTLERRLARSQFITSAELPTALAAAPGLSSTPIALIDFDVHPPAFTSLFEALQQSGVEVETILTSVFPASSTLHTVDDDHAELLAAATWIRNLRLINAQSRIAVVVPNLADRRPQIERVFAPILSPNRLPITAPPSPPIYEFSLGPALTELPIALTALDLLNWPLQPLPLERISALLLSAWFTASDPAVAAFDAFHLRETSLLRPELSLDATIRLAEHPRHHDTLADLLKRLRSLRKAAIATQFTPRPGQAEPTRHSHAQWADVFRTLLDAAGWTTHAHASSLAFQQHRRWESALDELSTLDFDGHRPDALEALASLTRILRRIVFAPESEDAPVQIIGPLELGGVAFDALWFLGADDLTWSPPISSAPLLPWQLQRTLGISGADRTRDDATAQAITARIAHSAPTVVFSFALHADEGTRRASSLLMELDLQPYVLQQDLPISEFSTYNIIFDDTSLPSLPGGPVKGGTQILKLQAACPFRAFAEQRLWSAQPDTREPGLDALERGNIVHRVMEFFWIAIATQANLRDLTPTETAETLDRAIDTALHTTPETSWDKVYLSVQRQRLHALLLPWLEIERNRPNFTVQPPEQKKSFELGPLTLELRIDRIDNTPHGDLILDYKTGLAAPAQWQSDRPDEPQLPLYSVLAQESGRQLAGVAFALLRAGDGLALKGYADDSSVFGKTSPMQAPTLAEQVEEWRSVLTALAVSFAEGDTRVLPKSYPKTCERCSQRILCRLDPSSLIDLPDDEVEAEGEPALV